MSPRLIALDTAHWAGVVADLVSDSNDRRRAAARFMPKVLERGYIPLLSWHHLEELLQHRDGDLVDARLRYLRSLPGLAWIRPSEPGAGPGSIVDLLRSEVTVALRTDADAARVRDGTRTEAIVLGHGREAVPEALDGWRLLRDELQAQQERSRRVAAIRRWRVADIDNLPLRTWLGQPVRAPEAAMPELQRQRSALEQEIAGRGDQRIENPARMAAQFMDAVLLEGVRAGGSSSVDPAVQMLMNAGLEPDDINPAATFRESMDLAVFRKRLAIAIKGLGVSWEEVKRKATRDRLPVSIIEDAMRLHSQDQPERKGSELNDTHLLCLAAYADLTLVDKRTLEDVRRVRAKVPAANQLLGSLARAATYRAIPDLLTPTG